MCRGYFEDYFAKMGEELEAQANAEAKMRMRALAEEIEAAKEEINTTLTKEEAEFIKELVLAEQWHNLRISEEDKEEYKITSSILKKLGYEED